MTYIDPDGEGTLELNTIELFRSLGWEVADCYGETFGECSHAWPRDLRAGGA